MRISLVLLALVASCFAQLNLYPNYAQGVEFWVLNGITADPCVNKEELSSSKQMCTGRQWPEPAVLVLVESVQSNAVAATLTMTGRNLVAGVLTLSQRHQDCTTPETGATFLVTPTLTTATSGTGDTVSTLTFTVPAGWRTSDMELEHTGRYLCYQPTAADLFRYTGFKIGAVWNCQVSVGATPTTAGRGCNSLPYGMGLPASDSTQTPPIVAPTTITATDALGQLSLFEQNMRKLRTTCCLHNSYGNSTSGIVAIGQCVNPALTQCCQGAAVDPSSQRCCSASLSLVQWYTQPCNCLPNGNPSSPVCPGTETCCTHTKYSELTATYTDSTKAAWPQVMGECYNSLTHRCCDTGFRYDPGQDQCCSINGLQSLNVPCPCASDSDCVTGSNIPNAVGTDGTNYCCTMSWPDPFEFADSTLQTTNSILTPYARCNKYNNYPSTTYPNTAIPIGTAPYQSQRCLGNCIDNRYQICCNGIACRKEFESCCNTTCCNKYTSTCMEGRIPGTPNTRFNYNELDQPYELCTSIEVLNPLRSFWIFVWPAYLLLMTCVCLAFVIAFVSKVSRRSFSMLERSMITISLFTIIFACACYFAPIYKYGVWVVIVNMFTIIVASARSKGLNLALIIVQFITLLYLFDPFNGNNYFGFASLRVTNGDPDPESAGILHMIQKSFHSLASFNSRKWCATYYDYFMKDIQLQDFRRDNIKVPSFGYCGHGWITALYIFEGFTLMLTLIQFVLDLIAYILRFKEQRSYEPIELEVRGENQVPMYPAY